MPVWNPRSDKELQGSHFYVHAFYNRYLEGKPVKGWPLNKIIRFHSHYVQLFRKRGWKHYSPIPIPQNQIANHLKKLKMRRRKHGKE